MCDLWFIITTINAHYCTHYKVLRLLKHEHKWNEKYPHHICPKKLEKPTAPGVPRRSPIQVLSRPDDA